MNNEMSEARKILDLFEKAGFTVTYFLHYDWSNHFHLSIKSTMIKDIGKDREKEPAIAGDIIPIIEQNNYRLINFKTGVDVAGDYAGTIYFEIIPAGMDGKQESPLGRAVSGGII
jgi:hypothetical protein